MKYLVVYSSRTGNTALLAEQVRKTLGEESCLYFGAPSEAAEAAAKEAELIFAGFWTDKGDCSGEMTEFLEGLHGQKIFLFGTAGFGGSEEYFSRILERVKAHIPEENEIIGSYMCQGKMPQSVRKRYESMLEQNPEDQRMQGMIDNFDRALAHPDEHDLKAFDRALEALRAAERNSGE